MTDEDVEKIIKRNMNLQMNLAGIRADFEEAQQRTWVELTEEDIEEASGLVDWSSEHIAWNFATKIEAKLKQKNCFADQEPA